jgi:hypothetical protein
MTKSNVSRASGAKIGGKAAGKPCTCCGIAPLPHGKPFTITFSLPDVVLDIPEVLLDTWGDDPFLAVKDAGFYLRTILPVKLSDRYAINFGTWLQVDPEVFREAWNVWNFPEYKDFAFDGLLANRIEPWRPKLRTHVKARVLDFDQVPYVVDSPDPLGARIIKDTWPHADVLPAYADLLKEAPPAEG